LLLGRPGSARALVRLASISNTIIDPTIKELALTEVLTEEDFASYAMSEKERSAVQNIIDFNFRCVLPIQSEDGMRAVLTAAKMKNISPVFVLTKAGRNWSRALSYGYTNKETLFIIHPNDMKRGPDSDLIKDRRHGILIVDEMIGSEEYSVLAMDFEKTVILTNRCLISDLGVLVSILSPGSPTDLLTNNNAIFKREVEVMGFRTTRPSDLAFLLNVVTDFLPAEPEPFNMKL